MTKNAASLSYSQEIPAPDPELKRLAPLLGTWKVEGQTEESEAGPARFILELDDDGKVKVKSTLMVPLSLSGNCAIEMGIGNIGWLIHIPG